MPIELPVQERCPFCRFANAEGDVVAVDEVDGTLAFLNPRQFGKGHVLVIPKRHAPTVLDLEAAEALSIMRQVHRIANAISKAFDPSGLNIFQNNGLTAGQMVPHYHVHIVPTYPGDQPGRIFNSADFERTPLEYRQELAAAIRACLPPVG
jgi:histidine triad (HIT) family protein